jgi:ParB-like chromosome segregation protein Spo0J
VVKLSRLYVNPTVEARAELAESLQRLGLVSPVVRDRETGEVVAGHQRERTCRQLGIPVRYDDREFATEVDRLRYAIQDNRTRPMRPAERAEVAAVFAAAGWSNRRIASLLDCDEGTVRSDLAGRPGAENSAPGRRTDAAGKTQPARKHTPAELERRRDVVARLRQEGHSTQAIARALGVAQSTITADAAVLGLPPQRSFQGDRPDPAPVAWRDDELTLPVPPKAVDTSPTAPSYRRSHISWELDRFNQGAREDDYVKSLAWDVEDARRNGDTDWIAVMAAQVDVLQRTLAAMARVLTDDSYQHTVAHSAHRFTQQQPDDQAPRLHAVPDP